MRTLLELSGGDFSLEILERRPGFRVVELTGLDVSDFRDEAGGHRWQRIPPTEKRGRVQTSTVTVAVLDVPDSPDGLNLDDVEITTTKGDGPGGQHRNKTESAVIAIHRPTGIKVRIESDRSQFKNKATALNVLAARVLDLSRNQGLAQTNQTRKEQVGSGERGDKIRTYRQKDNQVVDHRTQQRWQLNRWVAGEW